jgi:hypothetical protein
MPFSRRGKLPVAGAVADQPASTSAGGRRSWPEIRRGSRMSRRAANPTFEPKPMVDTRSTRSPSLPSGNWARAKRLSRMVPAISINADVYGSDRIHRHQAERAPTPCRRRPTCHQAHREASPEQQPSTGLLHPAQAMMRRGLPLRRVDVAPSTSPASKRRLIHRPTINAGAWSKANNVATAPTSAPGRPAPHAITDAATSKASPTPSHRRQRSGGSREVHLLAGGEVSKADQLPSVRHAEYEEAAASRHQAAVDDELDVLAVGGGHPQFAPFAC